LPPLDINRSINQLRSKPGWNFLALDLEKLQSFVSKLGLTSAPKSTTSTTESASASTPSPAAVSAPSTSVNEIKGAVKIFGQGVATMPATGSIVITPSSGGVNVQTADYLAKSSDSGMLISMNVPGGGTLTLPPVPPFNKWWIAVANVNASNATINPNGLDIDGSPVNITLSQAAGLFIYTDGVNYFSSRGLGGSATGGGSFVKAFLFMGA